MLGVSSYVTNDTSRAHYFYVCLFRYETSCCLGVELVNDLPQTSYHDFYAKEGHVLHFEHTDPIPNRNTPESLHACVQDVFENLRAIQSAPSVQVRPPQCSPITLYHFKQSPLILLMLDPWQMHYIPPPVTYNDEQVATVFCEIFSSSVS